MCRCTARPRVWWWLLCNSRRFCSWRGGGNLFIFSFPARRWGASTGTGTAGTLGSASPPRAEGFGLPLASRASPLAVFPMAMEDAPPALGPQPGWRWSVAAAPASATVLPHGPSARARGWDGRRTPSLGCGGCAGARCGNAVWEWCAGARCGNAVAGTRFGSVLQEHGTGIWYRGAVWERSLGTWGRSTVQERSGGAWCRNSVGTWCGSMVWECGVGAQCRSVVQERGMGAWYRERGTGNVVWEGGAGVLGDRRLPPLRERQEEAVLGTERVIFSLRLHRAGFALRTRRGGLTRLPPMAGGLQGRAGPRSRHHRVGDVSRAPRGGPASKWCRCQGEHPPSCIPRECGAMPGSLQRPTRSLQSGDGGRGAWSC